MTIRVYEKEGKEFYRVYVCVRSKELKRIRYQRVISGITTLTAARREEKRLIGELSAKVAKMEGNGLLWDEVIYRWQAAARNGYLGSRLNVYSTRDHFNRLKKYTRSWFPRIAVDLTKADGRKILEAAKVQGASVGLLAKIKNSINMVYEWGLEEGLIKSHNRVVHNSPVYGLGIKDKEEKIPPILTLEEVRRLLFEAKLQKHSWYSHWAFAVLTGMRSGELYALKWDDIDEDNGIIRVSKSFDKRMKRSKSTKNSQWRNVSISSQLREIITELKCNNLKGEYVLERLPDWKDGRASDVLRMFLKHIGIDKYVVFHTLRACFATHLLAAGAEQTKVMRMGGWADLKTFQIYIRMAGVDVKGVSEPLNVLPSKDGLDNIVNFRQK